MKRVFRLFRWNLKRRRYGSLGAELSNETNNSNSLCNDGNKLQEFNASEQDFKNIEFEPFFALALPTIRKKKHENRCIYFSPEGSPGDN